MANNKVSFFRQEVLRQLLTTQVVERPTSWWIVLGTAGGPSYITKPSSFVPFGPFSATGNFFASTAGGAFANVTQFDASAAATGWGTISYIGIARNSTAAAASDYVYIGQLSAAVTFGIGDTPRFVSGAIKVSET